MKAIFLGTGTSHGVPEIGCNCAVCTSENPKNKRLRSSLLIQDEQANCLLIDASVDFRQQALRENICNLKDILITHDHADHIFGLDDTRIFCRGSNAPINLYVDYQCNTRIRKIFEYVYDDNVQKGGGLPKFKNILITPGKTFSIKNFTITPIKIFHGRLQILGYRINNLAYLTDCSSIPVESYLYLQNLEVLVLDALRKTPHPTHFSLEQAVCEAKKIGAKLTYFTHMTHQLEYVESNTSLPFGMQLAYDGLAFIMAENDLLK